MKHLLRCLLLLVLPSGLFACDLCNIYLGVNPHYNQNTVGIRYRYRHFDAHEHAGSHDHSMTEKSLPEDGHNGEYFNTYEVWGKFYPHPKVQLIVSMPFAHNFEIEEGEHKIDVNSIGDAIAIAHYQIYNSKNDTGTFFNQRLFLGGGFKAPTGKFKQLNSDNEIDPHIQAGSGSWDFILSLAYLAKYKKVGLTGDLNYKINNKISNSFLFANRVNANLNVFYQGSVKSFTIIPNAGVYLEQAAKDQQNSELIFDSGGIALFSNIGLDFYFKKIALNFSTQIPLHEKLNGDQPENSIRVITGINYSF